LATETQDLTEELNKEPFPKIQIQIDNIVELQRGLLNPLTGVWQKTAEVRELTGFDEEHLATVENRKNITYIEYITEVLKLAVVSIGDIVNPQKHLNELTIGDRNALFLGIVRTSYGREKTFNVSCPSCKEKNEVTIDLYDDFPIEEPSFDPTETISVELKNGTTVKLRVPLAEDSLYAAQKAKTTAEQNTLILSRCVVFDSPVESAETWARSLNISDRNKLTNVLLNVKMGPRVEEVDVDCVYCGASMPVMIDWIFLILN
jgi:hypothetical protein